MLRTALRWVGATGLGAAAAAAVVQFVGDAALGVALGLCLAASVLLLVRIRREFPGRVTGDTWADRRWTGLSNGVVLFAALVGVLTLPVSDLYRVPVQLLVVLVGLVGYLAGSLAEMDRERVRRNDGDGTTGRAGGPTTADD